MKIFLFGSIAFDEIGQFRGLFKEVIRPEFMDKLAVSFLVDENQRHFGGCSGNTAYGLGLLKVPAYLVSRLGSDGADYRKAFTDWGMNVDFLEVAEGQTARAVITTDESGAQIAQFASGVIGTKAPAFVLPSVAEAGDLLLVGPENHDRMVQALKQGVAKGLRVFFDPGQLIHTFSREELTWAAQSVEAVLVNAYEWEILKSLGEGWEDSATPKSIVWITKGADGVTLYEKGVEKHLAAFAAESIEPTGAGDAFRAGVLAGLAKGLSPEESSKVGMILGAACVEHALAQGYTFSSAQAAALEKLGCA